MDAIRESSESGLSSEHNLSPHTFSDITSHPGFPSALDASMKGKFIKSKTVRTSPSNKNGELSATPVVRHE